MKNYVFVAMNLQNDFIHSFWQADKEINWSHFSTRKFQIKLKSSCQKKKKKTKSDFLK